MKYALRAALIVGAVASAMLSSAHGSPAEARVIGSRLNAGSTLTSGQELRSPNGQHLVTLGPYGDMKAFQIEGAMCNRMEVGAFFDYSQTARLTMQGDGNLVQYVNGKAVWASRTVGRGGSFVVIQDDRNLVMYTAAGRAVWWSGTVCNAADSTEFGDDRNPRLGPGHFMQSADRRYKLIMQADGNLVLYGPKGAMWHTRTNGKSGAALVQQAYDGNLVLYSTAGRPLWSLPKPIYPHIESEPWINTYLRLQNDGNLVLYFDSNYTYDQHVAWSSKHGWTNACPACDI